ncbi:MAG: hypothetical protein AABY87_03260 [bacterium]
MERIITEVINKRQQKAQGTKPLPEEEIKLLENEYAKKAQRIRKNLAWYDRGPLVSAVIVWGTCYWMYLDKINDLNGIIPTLIVYLGFVCFILVGALYVKHRIEDSFHYQRVREIIYVLETAYLAKVLDSANIDILWKTKIGMHDK